MDVSDYVYIYIYIYIHTSIYIYTYIYIYTKYETTILRIHFDMKNIDPHKFNDQSMGPFFFNDQWDHRIGSAIKNWTSDPLVMTCYD